MVCFRKKVLRELPVFIRNAGPGIKATIESIDNRSDFKVYMQNYAYAHGGAQRGPRRTGPEHEGFVSCAHTVEGII